MASTSAERTRDKNEEPITPDEWMMMKRGLLYTARKRARRKGLQCTIDINDIVWPKDGVCPILGEPLKKHRGKMERNTPSLDRRDSSLGYVPGNVYVVSWWANYLKEQLSVEQAERMLEYIRSG